MVLRNKALLLILFGRKNETWLLILWNKTRRFDSDEYKYTSQRRSKGARKNFQVFTATRWKLSVLSMRLMSSVKSWSILGCGKTRHSLNAPPPDLIAEKNYEPYDDGWLQYEEPSVTIHWAWFFKIVISGGRIGVRFFRYFCVFCPTLIVLRFLISMNLE